MDFAATSRVAKPFLSITPPFPFCPNRNANWCSVNAFFLPTVRPALTCRGMTDTDSTTSTPSRKTLHRVLTERGRGGRRGGEGQVFLVGTGPGDPELLTLKAVKAIRSADLLLYDRLVSDDVLELASPESVLFYVGKTCGCHSRTQEEIHELLLSSAKEGATVVRLKGGDPLIFGRGGEEMEFLRKQGVQVKVIPGITAASGVAAELGVPLTHRGVSNSVRYLTGHSWKGGPDPLHIAKNGVNPDSTLVVYMGLSTLPSLAGRLMQNGLPPDTPSVAVERGTTPQQKRVFGELQEIACKTTMARLTSPTLIIIGSVVALSPLWSSPSSLTMHHILEPT